MKKLLPLIVLLLFAISCNKEKVWRGTQEEFNKYFAKNTSTFIVKEKNTDKNYTGKIIITDKNGHVYSEEYYSDGVLYHYKTYYVNDNVEKEWYHNYTTQEGFHRMNSYDGNPKKYYTYNSKDSTATERRYYKGGQLKTEIKYAHDSIISTTEYKEDGTIVNF